MPCRFFCGSPVQISLIISFLHIGWAICYSPQTYILYILHILQTLQYSPTDLTFHYISNRLFFYFSSILAMVNRISRLWNFCGRRFLFYLPFLAVLTMPLLQSLDTSYTAFTDLSYPYYVLTYLSYSSGWTRPLAHAQYYRTLLIGKLYTTSKHQHIK